MADTPNEIAKGTPLNDNLALINQNFQALDDENRTKIVKDAGTPRVLLGYQKDGFGTGGDYGLKVSQDGQNVVTATDSQLAFSSAFNMFKIVETGTFTLPALDAAGGANDDSTTVVTTGVDSTTPLAFQAFVLNDSGGYNSFPVVSFNNAGAIQLWRTAAVELSGSDVQLRIFCQNWTGFPIVARTGRYYIFQETAA
jgi:hypothetical protein